MYGLGETDGRLLVEEKWHGNLPKPNDMGSLPRVLALHALVPPPGSVFGAPLAMCNCRPAR
jgi:hypothetical protein